VKDSLVANESEIEELRQALEKAERRISALKRVSKTRKLRYQRAEAELARLQG
jgi:chromosome segregation ATPase